MMTEKRAGEKGISRQSEEKETRGEGPETNDIKKGKKYISWRQH